jgi:hypothetical protein
MGGLVTSLRGRNTDRATTYLPNHYITSLPCATYLTGQVHIQDLADSHIHHHSNPISQSCSWSIPVAEMQKINGLSEEKEMSHPIVVRRASTPYSWFGVRRIGTEMEAGRIGRLDTVTSITSDMSMRISVK